jgi:hypothetical protein
MEPNPDRRQSPRQPADLRTACDLLIGGSITCRALAVCSLSKGGARLLVDRPFTPGETLWAFLYCEGRRLYCMCMARAVYAHPVSDKTYAVGVAFYRELDATEVEGLCADVAGVVWTPDGPG